MVKVEVAPALLENVPSLAGSQIEVNNNGANQTPIVQSAKEIKPNVVEIELRNTNGGLKIFWVRKDTGKGVGFSANTSWEKTLIEDLFL